MARRIPNPMAGRFNRQLEYEFSIPSIGMERAFSMLQKIKSKNEDFTSTYFEKYEQGLNSMKKYFAEIGIKEKVKSDINISDLLYYTGKRPLIWADRNDKYLGGESNVVGQILERVRRKTGGAMDLGKRIQILNFDDYILNNRDLMEWMVKRVTGMLTIIMLATKYIERDVFQYKKTLNISSFFVLKTIDKFFGNCSIFNSLIPKFVIPPTPEYIIDILVENKNTRFVSIQDDRKKRTMKIRGAENVPYYDRELERLRRERENAQMLGQVVNEEIATGYVVSPRGIDKYIRNINRIVEERDKPVKADSSSSEEEEAKDSDSDDSVSSAKKLVAQTTKEFPPMPEDFSDDEGGGGASEILTDEEDAEVVVLSPASDKPVKPEKRIADMTESERKRYIAESGIELEDTPEPEENNSDTEPQDEMTLGREEGQFGMGKPKRAQLSPIAEISAMENKESFEGSWRINIDRIIKRKYSSKEELIKKIIKTFEVYVSGREFDIEVIKKVLREKFSKQDSDEIIEALDSYLQQRRTRLELAQRAGRMFRDERLEKLEHEQLIEERLAEYGKRWLKIVENIIAEEKSAEKVSGKIVKAYDDNFESVEGLSKDDMYKKFIYERTALSYALSRPLLSEEKIQQDAREWIEANLNELRQHPVPKPVRDKIMKNHPSILEFMRTIHPYTEKQAREHERNRELWTLNNIRGYLRLALEGDKKTVPPVFLRLKKFLEDLLEPKFSKKDAEEIMKVFVLHSNAKRDQAIDRDFVSKEDRELYPQYLRTVAKPDVEEKVQREKDFRERVKRLTQAYDIEIGKVKKEAKDEYKKYNAVIERIARGIWEHTAVLLYIFFDDLTKQKKQNANLTEAERKRNLDPAEFMERLLQIQYDLGTERGHCGELIETKAENGKEIFVKARISCIMLALLNMISKVNEWKAIMIETFKKKEIGMIPSEELSRTDLLFATSLLMAKPIASIPEIFLMKNQVEEIVRPASPNVIGEPPKDVLTMKVVQYGEDEEVDVEESASSDEEDAVLPDSPERAKEVDSAEKEVLDDVLSDDEDRLSDAEGDSPEPDGRAGESDAESNFGFGKDERRRMREKLSKMRGKRREGKEKEKKRVKRDYLQLSANEINNIKEKISELNIGGKGDLNVLTQYFINCCIYVSMGFTPVASMRVNAFL